MCPRESLDGRDPDASMGKRDPPPIHKERTLSAGYEFVLCPSGGYFEKASL